MNNTQDVWPNAPVDAWAWERYPNGQCVWHCRNNGESYTKSAPNIDAKRSTLWRDPKAQEEADKVNEQTNENLAKLNIVLG